MIGVMNMILHGVEAPNIIHTNTLSENISDIQEKNRYDVILANPPFGGRTQRSPTKLPDQNQRNSVLVPATLHQIAQSRRTSSHRHQKHVPLQLRQCCHLPKERTPRNLRPTHNPRLPRWNIPRSWS